MKTIEEYKRALLDAPSEYIREKLLAEADKDGLTAWQLAELASMAAE